MNKILRTVAATVALAAASVAHAASSTFDYSYTFASGDVVKGSFTGDASGNLVTNLSNITAIVDGTPLTGSGALFNASYNPATFTWTADAGRASFDGTQNDFLFIDSHYPTDTNFTNYFYSINGVGTLTDSRAFAYGDSSVATSRWTLTSAVPETDNAVLLLAGMGLMGLVMRRKAARQ